MEKRIVIVLAVALAATGVIAFLQGGASGNTSEFFYADDLAAYGNDPGVYADGFRNEQTQPVRNEEAAVLRAKEECTIEYEAVQVAYDDNTAIWRVAFYTGGVLGGDQSVYLDRNGVIQLIVYGE